MVGILLSFWEGLFSGAMLVSGSVSFTVCISCYSISVVATKVLYIQLLRNIGQGIRIIFGTVSASRSTNNDYGECS